MKKSPSQQTSVNGRINPSSLLLLGVAGVSYALGIFTAKRPDFAKSPELAASTTTKPGVSGGSSRAAGIYRLPSDIEKLVTGGTIEEAMLQIFAENDPVKRSAAFSLLLATLTSENVLEAKEAMFQLTQKTGKTAHNEWGLLMGRAGELLGEKAMDSGNGKDRHRAMAGWAKAHPDEALVYLSQQDPSDQENLRNAWLYGVCRDNPGRALTCLLADPDFSKQNGGEFMKEAVQAQGLDAAQASLQQALDAAPGDVSTSPIFRNLFIELTNALLFRSWQSGTTEQTCAWLEKQRGAPYLIEPLVGHAAYDLALQGKPVEALAWIKRMGASGSSSLPGITGFRKAILERPESLKNVDETSLGQIVAQFGSNSAIESLAKKLDAVDPTQAANVRRLALTKSAPPP
jgi:hypothetical protein